MQAVEGLAKIMLTAAVTLVLAALVCGCSTINSVKSIGDTYSNDEVREIVRESRPNRQAKPGKADKPERPEQKAREQVAQAKAAGNPPPSGNPAPAQAQSASGTTQNSGGKNGLIINIRNAVFNGGGAQMAAQNPPPTVELPAPELTNVNLYARALEEKLSRRYNNTPKFSGKVAKVQLIPVGEPRVSLDGKKLRMEWSQVVYDIWGERLTELEQEYFVVTFGDGKPLMQRTRPTITVGLNNEGGYSEYAPVRGGKLSEVESQGNPGMFDRPDNEKTGLLDQNLEARNSADAPYLEYALPAPGGYRQFQSNPEPPRAQIPIIAPAAEHLQALTVQELAR